MIFNLMYDGDYNNYFRQILNEFHTYEEKQIRPFDNTKYLRYRFNDLLESAGQPIILIKHCKVTDGYIAAEETRNQN